MEVRAAFDAVVKKTKPRLATQICTSVSAEATDHSTASGSASQAKTQCVKSQLLKPVSAFVQEQSRNTQRTPATQKIEPVAQTFADVHQLASLSGNADEHGGRGGGFGKSVRAGNFGSSRSERTDSSMLSPYEAEKEQLKKAAEQEFVHNMTNWEKTMIRNFAVNPDLPQTAELVNYLQLLLQSPKGIEYERHTAAEQEAEKVQRIGEITEWANKNGRSPLLSVLYGEDTNGILNIPSGLSLVSAPFQGVDYVLDALETAYAGAPLPSSEPDFTETTQALREGVSQNMTETGQFFYNAAVSTADSLIAGWMGGGSAVGGIILGMGAASNTAHDIMNRGGTEEDALIGGAVSGILEGVFEKTSLGQLGAIRHLPADAVKAVLGNIAKSVVTNAGEEFTAGLAGTIFDTIFMGELSTYELAVQGYLSQGKSEADARRRADVDLLKRLGESAASGALTGALFGAGASADSYYRSQRAVQGEAKLRAMEMPTSKQLESMDANEPEARGAMVLLNLDQIDDAADRHRMDSTKSQDTVHEDAPVNIDLKYKKGWTDVQKAEADAKVKALKEAATVKTPVNRRGTSASARYKSVYGESSVPAGYDVDHTIDLQLGGPDEIFNLKPLERSVNRSLGKQVQRAIKHYPDKTEFGKFTIH